MDLHNDFKVVFTGHSLGGALTVHAAIDSMMNGLDPSRMKVYTFGQPRIGNKYLEEKLTQNVKECYRIVHNADIVSQLPPCISTNGLKGECLFDGILPYYPYHSIQEVFYSQDMKNYELCSLENPLCSRKFGPWWSGSDHVEYFGINVGEFWHSAGESF